VRVRCLSVGIQEQGVTVSKTALGAQVMKDRSVALSAQQRSALILCDGKRSAEDVVRMTAAVGVSLEDIKTLEALGLVTAAAPDMATHAAAAPSMPSMTSVASPVTSVADNTPHIDNNSVDFKVALNAAITLCSSLGFKGFGLNMTLADVDSLERLQKIAPNIHRVAGDAKYKPLHELIFGQSL
jgi:hypothetical protein